MLDHPEYTATLCGKVFGPKGTEIGNSLDGCGYKKFDATDKTLKKRVTVKAHRFVYEYFNGPIPEGLQIDHINRDKTDNRISNLRAVTHQGNMQNRTYRLDMCPEERIKSLGDDGCIYSKTEGKSFYVLLQTAHTQQRYLGSFKTKELAREARDKEIRNNLWPSSTPPSQRTTVEP